MCFGRSRPASQGDTEQMGFNSPIQITLRKRNHEPDEWSQVNFYSDSIEAETEEISTYAPDRSVPQGKDVLPRADAE